MEIDIKKITPKKLSNAWQTILIIFAIFSSGFYVANIVNDAVFTEDEIKFIVTETTQEILYDFEKKDKMVDSDDFLRGWIESDGITMEEYIEHCYTHKTRVYKGGLIMIENKYETRDEMISKYGDRVVGDLVSKLIRFQN